MTDMRGEFLFMALLTLSCATAVTHTGPWRYDRLDHSGYTVINPEDVAELVQHAEANFRSSPVAGHFSAPFRLVQVGRRPDGKSLLIFYFGESDAHAVYIFDTRGVIIDRYVYSYWR